MLDVLLAGSFKCMDLRYVKIDGHQLYILFAAVTKERLYSCKTQILGLRRAAALFFKPNQKFINMLSRETGEFHFTKTDVFYLREVKSVKIQSLFVSTNCCLAVVPANH